MTRRTLASLFLAMLALVVVARADSPADKKDDLDLKTPRSDSALEQERLLREFRDFKHALLTLKQRLEKSDRPEDRMKVEILEKALAQASKLQIDNQFAKLLDALRSDKELSIPELQKILQQNKELASSIGDILKTMNTGDRDAERKRLIEEYTKKLEQLKRVIREQNNARLFNERNMKDALPKQRDVTEDTRGLLKDGKNKGEGKPGDAKGDKSKSPLGKGEGKNDTKESKAGDKQDAAEPSSKEGDPSEGKEAGKENGSEGKPGEGKEAGKESAKEGKPGEAKEGNPGESKEAGKENSGEGKPGEGKEAGKESDREGKPGKAKESGKNSEGKPSEAKESGKNSEGKPGEGKEGKPGAGKPGEGKPSDGKPGESKEGQSKSGEGKPGEGKPGNKGQQGKPGDGKQGGQQSEKASGKEGGKESGEGKPGEGKADPQKSGESKPGEGKGDPKKGAEPKPANVRTNEKSDPKGKSDGKGEGKPSQSQSKSQSGGQGQQSQSKSQGQQGQQGQQGGAKGDGQQQQQQGNKPQGEQDQFRKKIKDAEENQQKAEDEIQRGKRDEGSKDQGEALKNLEEARKKLEDLLRQLRQEEIERVLAALQARCQKMLDMQIAVRNGTVSSYRDLGDGAEQRIVQQRANTLSDDEDKIVVEANKAISILEEEGSAVAFPEIFKEVRRDMLNVSSRLRKTEVGVVTQAIEQDIIDTLGEMIKAFKKARQENQQDKQQQQQQSGGKPADPKLIDLLGELKLIRSMQMRINNRTQTYGQEYPGEQVLPEKAKDDTERDKFETIQRELRELSESQIKLFKITNDLAKGRNK